MSIISVQESKLKFWKKKEKVLKKLYLRIDIKKSNRKIAIILQKNFYLFTKIFLNQ